MLRHLVLLVLFASALAQRDRVIRPEDVFRNDPNYRPSLQDNKILKNPFADTYNREDPDNLFFGFFPIWSAILACISVIFGFIAIFGLIGYCAGCRNPNRPLLMKKTKPQKVQMYLNDDDEHYEDAALSMLEERDYEKPFKNSRLTSLA